MRKKVISITILAVMLFSLLTPPTRTGAAGMSISKKKATLEVDAVLTLKVIGNTDGSAVKWSSSKKSVAKVTSKGKVTAKKEGTATITATVGSNKYKCVVTVVDSNKEEAIADPDPTPTPTPENKGPQIDVSDFNKRYLFTDERRSVTSYVNFTSVDCEVKDQFSDLWYISIKYSAISENALSTPFSGNISYWFSYQVLDEEGYVIKSGVFDLPDMNIDGKAKDSFGIQMQGEKGQAYSVIIAADHMLF